MRKHKYLLAARCCRILGYNRADSDGAAGKAALADQVGVKQGLSEDCSGAR